MKMNKRLLSGLLALVMVLGMIPLNAIATDETTAACEDCGAVGGHIVGCEHYIAPSCEFCHVELIGENVQHTTGCPTTCTCDPKPAEGEAHVSPCPLYTPVSGASLNLDGSESSESTGDTTGSTTSSTDGSSETTTAPTTQATTAPTTEATTTPTTQATTAPSTEATTAPTTETTTAPTTEATTAPTTEAMTEATEPQKTFAETLLEIDNLSDLLIEVCKEENLDAVLALTAEEITALRARAQALYDAIENPTEQDGWDLDDFMATMDFVAGEEEELAEEPSLLDSTSTISIGQDWSGGSTLSESATWKFQNGAVVTFKKPVTIPKGITLTLEGWGSIARYNGDTENTNISELFIVEEGGKLVINGASAERPFIIDGNDVIATKSAIMVTTKLDGKEVEVPAPHGPALVYSKGELVFNNAVIQNGKNRAPSSLGGGLYITSTGSLVMKQSTVTNNTAKQFGGGIYCTGTMEINDSVISNNVAATGTDEKVNEGRGGGFELSGAAASCTLNNTIIEHNEALYYGGGGQADNGAKVVMNAGTIFRKNKAVLHGAGAFHLTSDAKFVMNGGSMEDNFAQYCGGAIHSSYSCVLELNAGTIKNNIANGRGAGIHINTGGAITLNENITISGNEVYKDRIGTYAVVDETGDNITGMKYEGADADFGYGGGILIDSGTCTVAGATIKDNYALVGGGGVALTMLNMGEYGLDDLMVIKFTMTAGSVSNNITDGDGAGVYIMTNKAKENMGKVFNGATGGDKELSYEEALKRIDDTNRHGFTGQQIVDGIPEAVVSGGTIVDNVAQNNGGGLYLGEKTRFEINGTGDISSNEAVNGAGAYIASGTAVINGGTMAQNTASNNGGAIYVLGDVTMTDGSVTKNQAKNGGALYIDSEGEVFGEFLMSGGAINENTATVNGGAAYVAGGNVTIEHGSINSNKALTTGTADELQDATNNTGRGGAIYMAGDETTVFKMESGTMNNNTAANDGGAIFATGGTLYIGLEGCKDEAFGATCSHHTAKGDGRHHPQVMNNSAADTGGGIAIAKLANDEDAAAGKVYFYCGKADSNSALYKGVGKNVFMNGGEFYLYKAADVGEPRDPDLVIVGGTLHNVFTSNEYVKLKYYYQNSDTETQMEGSAEYAEFMNLPDGEYFWDAPEGMRFLGWTAQGAASGNLSNANVRNKEQYLSSGDPVQILDHEPESTDDEAGENTLRAWDGKDDGIMNLYALWVPEINDITYMDGMTNQEITNNPATYTFSVTSNIIDIQPVAKPGYDLVGWYIYQDENQNANWNNTLEDFTYERYNVDGTKRDLHYMPLTNRNSVLKLEAGLTNFGDITMIAKYVPAFTTLVIDKNFPANADYSIDVGQSFVFTITGRPSDTTTYPDPINMTVVVQGDGSVTVEHIPVGKYIVKELNDWSWRYKTTTYDLSEKKTGDPVSKRSGEGFVVENIEASDAETTYIVTFTNTRTENKWLDGDSFCRNWFNGRSFVGSKSD